MNIKDIIKKINKKTKAIILVHLYGSSYDLNEINKIKKYKIKIIEDCAEAIGTKFNNKYVGSGRGCFHFSFYGTKLFQQVRGEC